jgi:hypothetical protein
MRNKILTRFALGLATSALAGCVYGGGEPPPLPKLADDPKQPVLALFEHVLTGYFAGAGVNGPTTCASLRPNALTAEQEKELIARFVRLAPGERCQAAAGGLRDAITHDPAQVVEVYEFACSEPTRCIGWASVPGAPATRYAMRFDAGAWRFTGDPRLIAE